MVALEPRPVIVNLYLDPRFETAFIQIMDLHVIVEVVSLRQSEVDVPLREHAKDLFVTHVFARRDVTSGGTERQAPRQQVLSGLDRMQHKSVSFHHRMGELESMRRGLDQGAGFQPTGRDRHVVVGGGQTGGGIESERVGCNAHGMQSV